MADAAGTAMLVMAGPDAGAGSQPLVVKAVPDGAREVCVASVVDGQAGALWLVEPPKQDAACESSEVTRSVQILELFLMLCKGKEADSFASPPRLQELIAVRNPSTSTWHRGYVKSFEKKTDSYLVFLIDHGITLRVSLSDISDLPGNMKEKEPSTFQFILYGVMPAEMVVDYDTYDMKLVAAKGWSPVANAFMRSQVEKSHIGYIITKASNKKDNTLFGDLYIVAEKGFLNLGLLLVYSKHGILDHQLFAEKYNLELPGKPMCKMDDSPSDILRSEFLEGKCGKKVSPLPSHQKLLGGFNQKKKELIGDSHEMKEVLLQNKPDFGKVNSDKDPYARESSTDFNLRLSFKKQENCLKPTSENYECNQFNDFMEKDCTIFGRRSVEANTINNKEDEQLDYRSSCDRVTKPFCTQKKDNFAQHSPREAASATIFECKGERLTALQKGTEMHSAENSNKSRSESHASVDNFQRSSNKRGSENNLLFNDKVSSNSKGYVNRKGRSNERHSYEDKLLETLDTSRSKEKIASMVREPGPETKAFISRHFQDKPFVKNRKSPKENSHYRRSNEKIGSKSSRSSDKISHYDAVNRRDGAKKESYFSKNNSFDLDSRMLVSWSDEESAKVEDTGNTIKSFPPSNAKTPVEFIPHSAEIQNQSLFSERNVSFLKTFGPHANSKKFSRVNKSWNSDDDKTIISTPASKLTKSQDEDTDPCLPVDFEDEFNLKSLEINPFTGERNNIFNDSNRETGSLSKKKIQDPEMRNDNESMNVPAKIINENRSMHRINKHFEKPTGSFLEKEAFLSGRFEPNSSVTPTSDGASRRANKPQIVRTYFPAGFNNAEADEIVRVTYSKESKLRESSTSKLSQSRDESKNSSVDSEWAKSICKADGFSDPNLQPDRTPRGSTDTISLNIQKGKLRAGFGRGLRPFKLWADDRTSDSTDTEGVNFSGNKHSVYSSPHPKNKGSRPNFKENLSLVGDDSAVILRPKLRNRNESGNKSGVGSYFNKSTSPEIKSLKGMHDFKTDNEDIIDQGSQNVSKVPNLGTSSNEMNNKSHHCSYSNTHPNTKGCRRAFEEDSCLISEDHEIMSQDQRNRKHGCKSGEDIDVIRTNFSEMEFSNSFLDCKKVSENIPVQRDKYIDSSQNLESFSREEWIQKDKKGLTLSPPVNRENIVSKFNDFLEDFAPSIHPLNEINSDKSNVNDEKHLSSGEEKILIPEKLDLLQASKSNDNLCEIPLSVHTDEENDSDKRNKKSEEVSSVKEKIVSPEKLDALQLIRNELEDNTMKLDEIERAQLEERLWERLQAKYATKLLARCETDTSATTDDLDTSEKEESQIGVSDTVTKYVDGNVSVDMNSKVSDRLKASATDDDLFENVSLPEIQLNNLSEESITSELDVKLSEEVHNDSLERMEDTFVFDKLDAGYVCGIEQDKESLSLLKDCSKNVVDERELDNSDSKKPRETKDEQVFIKELGCNRSTELFEEDVLTKNESQYSLHESETESQMKAEQDKSEPSLEELLECSGLCKELAQNDHSKEDNDISEVLSETEKTSIKVTSTNLTAESSALKSIDEMPEKVSSENVKELPKKYEELEGEKYVVESDDKQDDHLEGLVFKLGELSSKDCEELLVKENEELPPEETKESSEENTKDLCVDKIDKSLAEKTEDSGRLLSKTNTDKLSPTKKTSEISPSKISENSLTNTYPEKSLPMKTLIEPISLKSNHQGVPLAKISEDEIIKVRQSLDSLKNEVSPPRSAVVTSPNKLVYETTKQSNVILDPDPCVEFVVDSGKKIMDQLQSVVVLLHGAPPNFKPLNNVTDACFRRDVHEALRNFMMRLMRLQRYAWPAVQQGSDLVLVGPPLSGKTMGYLVPCIDLLLQDIYSGKVPKGNGPVFLILCSGSKTCNQIREKCWDFIKQSSKDVKMVVAYGGGAEKVDIKLVNGCHILISTPRCFLRLLAKGKVVVNFARLKYLVFDEADILTLRFLREVEQICCAVERSIRARTECRRGLQVVVAAEKWCPGIEALARSLARPLVCISAFLEAIAYAHLKPVLHHVTESTRLEKLRVLMKEVWHTHKALVVCEAAQLAEAAAKALRDEQMPVLLAHDDMEAWDIHQVFQKWSWAEVVVLVCTDAIHQEMRFQGSSLLVHLDLSSPNKSQFSFRCSALFEHLPSMFDQQEGTKPKEVELSMHIFISDTDKEPLPELVRFVKRLGHQIDPDLEKRANVAELEKEAKKECFPLCYNTKAFGDCWNKSACYFRHVICKRDEPLNIPTSGTVKIKIKYAHDACNFSVRLIEHSDENGNSTKIPNKVLSIARKLHLHFKDNNNRILLENPKAHDICAVGKPEGLYERTEILAVARVDKNRKPKELIVRFIDDGSRAIVKVENLFELPESLKILPPQSVEIFLCGLIPCDLDWSWGRATNLHVIDILSDAKADDKFLVGKVTLALGHTLWLESLVCLQHLPTLKTSTIKFSLRRRLLDDGLAVENTRHIERLRNACQQAGLAVSLPPQSTSAGLTVNQQQDKIENCWAFLPEDEFSIVHFIVGDHPGRFYVRLQKFEDLIYKLGKKLQKIAEEKSTKDRVLFAGDFCIGRFPSDGKWYRARVEDAQEDNLQLFFVDHGDRAFVCKSEAFPLPKDLIVQLPFQAIECCLAGVSPDEGNKWSERAIDTLYDITAKPGTVDGVKVLYTKPLGKHFPADCTGGYRYSVVLIECNEDNRSILNQCFVANGVATQMLEERELLDSVDVNALAPLIDTSQSEEEDDDDEIPRPLCPEEVEFSQGPPEGEVGDWDNELVQQHAILSPLDSHDNNEKVLPEKNTLSTVEAELEEKLNGFKFKEVNEDEIIEFFSASMAHFRGQKSLEGPTAACSKQQQSLSSCATAEEQKTKKEEEEEEEEGKSSFHDSLSGEDSSSSDTDTEDKDTGSGSDPAMPPLSSTTRRPQVLWRQSTYAVWVRVDLPATDQYYLCWSLDSLQFWTVKNDDVYAFDLKLFGAINPHEVEHFGGLFVQIKLPKLVLGVDWLRLTKQRRVAWVKVDYSAEHDRADEEAEIQRQVSAHLKAIQEAQRKELKQDDVLIIPADEASSTDSDLESNASDIVPFQEDQYDPYDPLN